MAREANIVVRDAEFSGQLRMRARMIEDGARPLASQHWAGSPRA
jgi:hypothetical protein